MGLWQKKYPQNMENQLHEQQQQTAKRQDGQQVVEETQRPQIQQIQQRKRRRWEITPSKTQTEERLSIDGCNFYSHSNSQLTSQKHMKGYTMIIDGKTVFKQIRDFDDECIEDDDNDGSSSDSFVPSDESREF